MKYIITPLIFKNAILQVTTQSTIVRAINSLKLSFDDKLVNIFNIQKSLYSTQFPGHQSLKSMLIKIEV